MIAMFKAKATGLKNGTNHDSLGQFKYTYNSGITSVIPCYQANGFKSSTRKVQGLSSLRYFPGRTIWDMNKNRPALF
jgi:hypothetical protein